MPFALDNDAFTCWRKQKPWDERSWLEMIDHVRMSGQKPLWALVPDVVADRQGTLDNWKRYAPMLKERGWSLAMAVQDGMTPDDLDADPMPDVCFVGGTDRWKLPNLKTWTTNFPRVHAARINAPKLFEWCEELGCESIDGTGWFRDPSRKDKLPAVISFIEGNRARKTTDLFQ